MPAKKAPATRKATKRRRGGTVLVGADGSTYFIPDSKLRAFKLDQKSTRDVKRAVGGKRDSVQLAAAIKPKLANKLGLMASDDEDTVTSVNIGVWREVGD